MAANVIGVSPGVVGQTSRPSTFAENALFYQKFSGEIYGFFMAKTLTEGRVNKRTLRGAKSAGFQTYGQLVPSMHAVGAELAGADGVGNRVPFNERVINTDGVTMVHEYVHDIDELKSHFDVRSPIAKALGYALAWQNDQDRFASIIRAARQVEQHPDLQKARDGSWTWGGQSGAVDASPPSGASGDGSTYQQTWNGTLRGAALSTTASSFINALMKVRQGFVERNAMDNTYLAVQPAQYYLLLNAPSSTVGPLAINRDWSPNNGSLASGTVGSIAGMELMVTTNLPNTDITARTAAAMRGNSYNGDFSSTIAVAWQPDAIGLLEVMGITSESERLVQNQATLMLAKYCRGSNILRPSLAAEIWGSDTAATDAKLFPV